ncbi:hypothetical protein HanXRQr2_Chr04g0169141 [Helianthus annuus]|uniref:Uncharacterized protein n=1 Tax=Helianthus annuus TaxID=4232 RepID=A0A9K3J7X0_HELAN|nr:hypothetical protein HanXRQr2_Chr04g0169141 [Helianthus annuus]
MAADLSLSRLYKQTTQLTTLSRHPPFLSFSLRNPTWREKRRRDDGSAVVCGSGVNRPRDRVLIWLRFSFHSQICFVRFETRVGSVNKESWFLLDSVQVTGADVGDGDCGGSLLLSFLLDLRLSGFGF